MSSIHIYAPPVTYARRIGYCQTCRCRRRMVQAIGFDLNVWYCLGCGGEPHQRSRFKKITSYRAELIRNAKAKWNQATDFKTAAQRSADQILKMW